MLNLTDAQLEKACRYLCKFRGENPDEVVYGKVKRWTQHTYEVRNRHAALQAQKAIEDAISG